MRTGNGDDFDNLARRLTRQGLIVADNHLAQARAALESRHWESANAQSRTFVEAVFDEVAKLRLQTSKRGGEARKLLEASGVLAADDARLIKSFFDVASGEGSHAGTSREETARGRFLVALGLAHIGLALIPELVRVEDVVTKALHAPTPATPLPTDAEMHTSCPTCHQDQRLADAEVRREGEDTVYFCQNGCQLIVIVGSPGDSPWPGRGCRMGDHVIRNAGDLFLPVGTSQIKIPASPAALMKERPR